MPYCVGLDILFQMFMATLAFQYMSFTDYTFDY